MQVDIVRTDFQRDRLFLEEAEQAMYIESGMARPDEHGRLEELADASLTRHQDRVSIGTGAGFCARLNDSPVGFVFCRFDTEKRKGWVTTVYVAEPYREQGIGKRLMAAVLDEADSKQMRDVGLMVTSANERAIRMYTSLGFAIEKHEMRRSFPL